MPPRVSVIIPSRDGHVSRLLASLDAQSFRDFEVHPIKSVFPQGRAINEGANIVVLQEAGPFQRSAVCRTESFATRSSSCVRRQLVEPFGSSVIVRTPADTVWVH